MYPRRYWVTFLVNGAVASVAVPYFFIRSDDAMHDGLIRLTAWFTGFAAFYLFVWWAQGSRRAK